MRCEQDAVWTGTHCTLPTGVTKRQRVPLESMSNDSGASGVECKRARHAIGATGSAVSDPGEELLQIRAAIEHWHTGSSRLLGDGPPLSWGELQTFCRGACVVPAVRARLPVSALGLMQAVVHEGARTPLQQDALSASQRAGIVGALLTAWKDSYLAERVDAD